MRSWILARRGGGKLLYPAFSFVMPRSWHRLTTLIVPLLLGGSLLGVYLSTLAPGLTWANYGADGGDLITAAATGGVPHPTGYPLYLLLARLFQLLPVGSLAFRTNLLSAIAMATAAVLVYLMVRREAATLQHGWSAALISGSAFGLAPLVWSQAVITEVYALQALLVALVLYLYTEAIHHPSPHLDRWRGLALGLAMGNHLTSILLLPAILLNSMHLNESGPARTEHSWFANHRFDRASLLRQLGWLMAGLSLYLILPLRALAGSPVNWGNAGTPGRLWWLVSGQLYQSYYLQAAAVDLWERSEQAVTVLLQQSGIVGLALALIGLIVFWAPSPLYLLTAWTAAVSILFAVYYGAADWVVYLIPALVCLSIWIGLGLVGLSRQWKNRSLRVGLALALLGLILIRSAALAGQVDASQDRRAESFGKDVLAAAPQDAILFAQGDEAVFALWYFHFALGQRPDVAVLAIDLLHFDWYQETLHSSYPALVVPGPFPWPESIAPANPRRAACDVRYSDHMEMYCSPAVE
jgi:hypothetical protein